MTDTDRLIGPDEIVLWFAERGVTMAENTVRRAIKAKQLPGRIVGARYLASENALNAWFCGPSSDADQADAPPTPLIIPFIGRKQAAS